MIFRGNSGALVAFALDFGNAFLFSAFFLRLFSQCFYLQRFLTGRFLLLVPDKITDGDLIFQYGLDVFARFINILTPL